MLYKRSKTKFYWYRFTPPDGQRAQKPTRTIDKKLAQEFEDKLATGVKPGTVNRVMEVIRAILNLPTAHPEGYVTSRFF